MNRLDFIYNRHSVRKYKDEPIPQKHIEKILHAAVHAPTGKNLQDWHFVVVKDRDKIEQIAQIIEKKNDEISKKLSDEEWAANFKKFVRYSTVFRTAPVLVLVYCGEYIPTGVKELKAIGACEEEIQEIIRTNPGLQSVSAAVENLMLAAADMGYGTCWMTSGNYAAREINQFINFHKEGHSLVAMTPIGLPAVDPRSPERKPLEDVVTIIE